MAGSPTWSLSSSASGREGGTPPQHYLFLSLFHPPSSTFTPLFSYRLDTATLQYLAKSLCLDQEQGQEDEEGNEQDQELARRVRRGVEEWKEREGSAGTLASFLLLLHSAGLEGIEGEIRSNEFNSRCSIAGSCSVKTLSALTSSPVSSILLAPALTSYP